MKTIQKILWGFISTAICLLYKTDAAHSQLQYIQGVLPTGHAVYKAYNGIIIAARETGKRCFSTDRPDLYNSEFWSALSQIYNAAYNEPALAICSHNQYVAACFGQSVGHPGNQCSEADYITCADCPKLSGRAVFPNNNKNAFKIPYSSQSLPSSTATGCFGIRNATISYVIEFYVPSQIIIKDHSITNCRATGGGYSDPSGTYEFTSPCYYTK